ncbi:MAG: sn-glycerol-3-phosphate ABC transporter ATP-binding protein UgpC [Clostridia bacterium]|nr:sn-glycerol-3-phosphate ABC transporter ATP-binding protein UgpC [Clostridia bacterium]
MAELSLQNLNKVYDNGVQAVFDFGLDINDGEFIVLVGPSGCGKSTTLRMIAGLEEITSGKLVIGGRDVTNMAAKDRDIAMVFQNYALYAHMTVYENMGFSLMLRGEDPDETHEKVMAAAEILGLTDQLNKKPKQLSGGQRQRVAVGRAIVRNPKVFLFDEPLSNLDAKLRGSMRRELKLLHQRLKTTIIYVTHDQIEALTLADRIVVMDAGHVQQIGRPIELYDHPANLFVASFIGLPPMNRIPMRVLKDGTLRNGEVRYAPTDAQRALLAPYSGKLVVMGVRPEDMTLGGSMQLIVRLNENLGQHTLVHGNIGKKRVVCKFMDWCEYRPGDVINVGIRSEKVHFFDPDTTNAIG